MKKTNKHTAFSKQNNKRSNVKPNKSKSGKNLGASKSFTRSSRFEETQPYKPNHVQTEPSLPEQHTY